MTSVTQTARDMTPFSIIMLINASSSALKDIDVEESCTRQFGVLSGVEGCCLLGAIIGPVETVFWAAIFLLVKTVHLFIPRSFTVATSICGFTYNQFVFCSVFTVTAVTGLVSNFFTSSGKELFDSADWIIMPMGRGLGACDGIVNYQLF